MAGLIGTLVLFFGLSQGSSLGFELTLVHMNDFHARFEEFNQYLTACSQEETSSGQCFGGVARLVSAVQDIRSSRENVIFLAAGDNFQGTLWYTHYQGAATAYFTNKLDIDAAALGHHEFADGLTVLSSFLDNITYPVVSSNLNSEDEPLLDGLYKSSVLLTVGGEQVGVVGYTPQTTTRLVTPEYVKNLMFEDEIDSIQGEVDKLLSGGVNKIIVLGQGGLEFDQKIAREVDGIDVIVGGGSFNFLYTGEPPSNEVPAGPYPYVVDKDNGERVLLVNAYGYGKYVGNMDLTFDDDGKVMSYGGNPKLLNSTITQDVATLNEIQKWKEPLQYLLTTTIGKNFVFLNGTREECRGAECNLGNLLTDAILASYLIGPNSPGDDWTDVAIVVWNGGAIRNNIDQGSITIGEVLEAFPFRNEIIGFRLKGQFIREMLEHSVTEYNALDLSGAFLQMTGLKVEYNLWRPSGQRVVKVQVICAECLVPRYMDLDLDKMYGMLTSKFLFAGGDGYRMLHENAEDFIPFGKIAADAVVAYISRHAPITQGVEERIRFTNMEISPYPSHGPRTLAGINIFLIAVARIALQLC